VPATPFRSVHEKILERCKQERAKPSAIGIDVTEPAALEYHDKKILREVLCVRH